MLGFALASNASAELNIPGHAVKPGTRGSRHTRQAPFSALALLGFLGGLKQAGTHLRGRPTLFTPLSQSPARTALLFSTPLPCGMKPYRPTFVLAIKYANHSALKMQELFCILTTPPAGIGHPLSMSGTVGASSYIPQSGIYAENRNARAGPAEPGPGHLMLLTAERIRAPVFP